MTTLLGLSLAVLAGLWVMRYLWNLAHDGAESLPDVTPNTQLNHWHETIRVKVH